MCSDANSTPGSGNTTTCNNPTNCTGLSSYYALDITDVEHPVLLWEFSHPFLGYSYSGPAVIHKVSTTGGDQYYVMFLSGPTSPTDGSSIQESQAFVLTLNTTNLGISSVYDKDLGIANGFGGRLFTYGLDVNGDGYTDFVFFGYAGSPTGSASGWQGGIGKIYTSATTTDLTTEQVATDPSNWDYDMTSYANIAPTSQPITSKVATEQCFNTTYLYAGTGRYFFPQDDYTGSGSNYIMGIPFTCDEFNNNCTAVTSLGNSASCSPACMTPSSPPSAPPSCCSVCTNAQQSNFSQAGWEYALDPAEVVTTGPLAGSYLQERLITDPTMSSTNTIYFTTTEPTSNPCQYGGQTRIWAMNCATGGAQSDTTCSGHAVTDTSGTLYLQTSTGAIYQINSGSFANNANSASTGDRASQWFAGIPPESAAPVAQSATVPPRTGALIQWIEK